MELVPIEELCISGGATRGISFVGVLNILEKEKLLIKSSLKKCVGTSIGSFILCLYLIGYSTEDIYSLMMNMDLSILNDVSFNEKLSILNGSEFRSWIHRSLLVKKDPDTYTLQDLYNDTKINFIIVQTCLNKGIIYMNYEGYPKVLVIDAIIASMSLPFIFPPYKINNDYFVDGGVLDNFAVQLLSKNGYGITGSDTKCDDLHNMMNLLSAIVNTIKIHIGTFKTGSIMNIINVYNDVNIINFNLNNDDKVTLFKIGQKCAKEFLKIKRNNQKLLEEINTKNSFNTS